MSDHKNASAVTPEFDTRQIDHNGSIRADYMTAEELGACAAALASGQVPALPGLQAFEFFSRHRENEKEILRVYRISSADVEAGATITPAAEWLLDNHYIVEEGIQEVRRDFPKKFFRQLPTMKVGDMELPRTLVLAWLYVAHTHSQINTETLATMVEGFQSVQTLEIGELWALPSFLRFVLVENLRRIALRVERSRDMRRRANDAADEVIRLSDVTACESLFASIAPLATDSTFATQFHYRLRNGSQTSDFAIKWLEERLKAIGTDAETVATWEQNRLSSGNVTMGSLIKSLRLINDTEWSVWFEDVSQIDKILRAETDYGALDFGSRNAYRNRIEMIARRCGKSEVEVAKAAIRLTQEAADKPSENGQEANVGAFLAGSRRTELEKEVGYSLLPVQHFVRAVRRLNWFAIAGPVVLLTVLAMAAVGAFLGAVGLGWPLILLFLLMFSLPASEGATGLFNTLVTFFVRPARLVGFEFKEGIPEDARTLVVVPCLIGNRDQVDELVRNLEVHYLANPHGAVSFALVSDWPDSKVEENDADTEVLDYAKQEIARLNQRYKDVGERFFLLHRRRLYNEAEGAWMGWERKRGKLHELNLLLRGDRDTNFLPGANRVPAGVKYVMTLDADTRLMREAVTKLVGKMHHPINRPVHDPKTGRVISGYGVLQPRVTPSLTTGQEASVFQRVFSVGRGIDPYVFTVSDVYQDLTGEGSFTGKGLYDVDAFETALKGRIEENTVLSHDLLEGSFARCGLVTDVELVEDFPTRYEVEVSRQHRWARGDWQLIPYIFDAARDITALGRWKMFDNLRRSLTPIAWAFASVLGWYFLDPLGALVWQIILIFSLFVAPTISLISNILPRSTDIVQRVHFSTLWSDIRDTNAQVALRIVFIADSAWMMADAIIRSIYRLFVSRKKMLEWRTAASVQSSAQVSIAGYYRKMWHAPAVAFASLALAAAAGDNAFLVGIPFVLLWVLSPGIAWYVSQSAETEDQLFVPDDVAVGLRRIGRRTWRYFDTFVTPEQNYLPPDNVQESPQFAVATRTSPTNIGVYLLSTISARRFGWIGFQETIERLENTITTLEKMEKYRGHLINWYHTDTLKTLGQRYVSTVDSGNLAGHLVAVSSALREWAEAPSAHLQANLDGLGDVAGILRDALKDLPDDRKNVRPLRRRLEERITGFTTALASVKREHEFASIRIINLAVLARDLDKLAANLHHEVKSAASEEVTKWTQTLVKTCEGHVADSVFDISNIDPLRAQLASLRDRARDLAFSMDFSFLFRKERRLLSIGFRVDSKELDEACYDLLASEARLTSLFAIAKGDIPTEHWYKLGRQVVPIGTRGALISWSGSMFEYLMPPLVMQERQGGILNQTNNLIVKEQINHGRRLGIAAWGISEAAFNARDHNLNYQYTNFGVPTLGLKRGLGQNAVIAPYASILAAQYDPISAYENLKVLEKLGAVGLYGYHDAVDFTPTRVPDGKTCAVVYNYYAHHHGMSVAAVANVCFNGWLRELFHADPVVEAAELLLQEKAPREVPVMNARGEETPGGKGGGDQLLRAEFRNIADPQTKDRELVFLSNGHYNVMLTATGSGYSRWNGLNVTRWKADPTEDRWGTFIFLRDTASGDWWSATAEPRRIAGESNKVLFSDDKAEFHKTVGEIQSTVECIVANEFDAEGRRITLINTGTEDRFIEVTSYMEPVISNDNDDNAHPAFSRMFVKTEIGRRGDVIRAWRNKRNHNEPDMWVAHLAADNSGPERPTEFETDRRRFVGRGRTLGEAAAFDAGATLSGVDGFTLDPVLVLRRVVRVPAGKKVQAVFWTIAAPNRQDIDKAIERYRHSEAFGQELIHAWTRTQVQLRHVGVTSQQAVAYQHLGRYLTYPDMHLRADAGTVEAGLKSQSSLWGLSISGDFPIFTLRVNDDLDYDVVKEALSAQEYLRSRGVVSDLVILNEKPASYAQDMQHALEALVENAIRFAQQSGDGRPNVFTARKDVMDEATWSALLAISRVVLHARNGKIMDQVNRAVQLFAPNNAVSTSRVKDEQEAVAVLPPPPAPFPNERAVEDKGDLDFWNGFGGFTPDGAEYVVRLYGGQSTPQPWINVISNYEFGFHVAAEGGAFTWSRNSRDYQLTQWTNDAVTNRPGEAFHVADLGTGAVYTPFAALSNDPEALYEARHGMGYSRFLSSRDGLALELTQTVDRERPVKVSRLTLTNEGPETKTFRVYGSVEWMLGNNRAKTAPFILSSREEGASTIVATNPYSLAYSGRFAFFSASEPLAGVTTSRREFIGRNGNIRLPQAVAANSALSGQIESDGDPCAVLAVDVTLKPGETKEVRFLLGDTDSADKARALADEARAENFETLLDRQKAFWGDFTGRIKVETPDKAFNHLVNRWLPYQALGCRIMARAAFYQASGAYGFRDQLQDTLNLILQEPSLARAQILNAASRQFKEGDVLHWWLPDTGAGVRTLISDDVVWLAHAVHRYVSTTGDKAVLEEKLPFLMGEALKQGQHDSFFKPDESDDIGSLYEHAARALDLAITRTGDNGLPLILGGDWNDGMNRVGIEGKGTSVWLGWFLAAALRDFLPYAEERGDAARKERWASHLASLKTALETAGWDGAYYRRGTFDNGAPLGSTLSDECQIDSLGQSWSVLSGMGDPARSEQAMDAVMNQLVDSDENIIRLFTPPFAETRKDPGYIRAYPPGVRENGGQYTHAAIWVVMALAKLGRAEDAWRCFSMLNPVNHALDKDAAEKYRVEPYVVAADVYGEDYKAGRGGWTWYTGSAGWLYRTAIEGILGIARTPDGIDVAPALPEAWDGYSAEIAIDGRTHKIAVSRAGDKPVVTIDGEVVKADA